MQPIHILPIIWSLILLVLFLSLFGGRLKGLMHLVSRNELIGKESWNKLSQLWQVCEADLDTYNFSQGRTFVVRVSYTGEGGERVSKSFDNTDVNAAVSDAYDWAVLRGILKSK